MGCMMQIKNVGKKMILRKAIAEGDTGDEPFDVGISGAVLVFNFTTLPGQWTTYTVAIESILKDVIAFRKKENEKKIIIAETRIYDPRGDKNH